MKIYFYGMFTYIFYEYKNIVYVSYFTLSDAEAVIGITTFLVNSMSKTADAAPSLHIWLIWVIVIKYCRICSRLRFNKKCLHTVYERREENCDE